MKSRSSRWSGETKGPSILDLQTSVLAGEVNSSSKVLVVHTEPKFLHLQTHKCASGSGVAL